MITENHIRCPCLLEMQGEFLEYDDFETEYVPECFWAKEVKEIFGEKFVYGVYLDPAKPDSEVTLRLSTLLRELDNDEVISICTPPDALVVGEEYEFVTRSKRFRLIERTKFGLRVLWLPIDENIGPDVEEWSWSFFCEAVIRPVQKW